MSTTAFAIFYDKDGNILTIDSIQSDSITLIPQFIKKFFKNIPNKLDKLCEEVELDYDMYVKMAKEHESESGVFVYPGKNEIFHFTCKNNKLFGGKLNFHCNEFYDSEIDDVPVVTITAPTIITPTKTQIASITCNSDDEECDNALIIPAPLKKAIPAESDEEQPMPKKLVVSNTKKPIVVPFNNAILVENNEKKPVPIKKPIVAAPKKYIWTADSDDEEPAPIKKPIVAAPKKYIWTADSDDEEPAPIKKSIVVPSKKYIRPDSDDEEPAPIKPPIVNTNPAPQENKVVPKNILNQHDMLWWIIDGCNNINEFSQFLDKYDLVSASEILENAIVTMVSLYIKENKSKLYDHNCYKYNCEYLDMVKIMVSKGVLLPQNQTMYDMVVFLMTCSDYDAIEYFISNGISINVTNSDGYNGIEMAMVDEGYSKTGYDMMVYLVGNGIYTKGVESIDRDSTISMDAISCVLGF
jgi:hypothetical protein